MSLYLYEVLAPDSSYDASGLKLNIDDEQLVTYIYTQYSYNPPTLKTIMFMRSPIANI